VRHVGVKPPPNRPNVCPPPAGGDSSGLDEIGDTELCPIGVAASSHRLPVILSRAERLAGPHAGTTGAIVWPGGRAAGAGARTIRWRPSWRWRRSRLPACRWRHVCVGSLFDRCLTMTRKRHNCDHEDRGIARRTRPLLRCRRPRRKPARACDGDPQRQACGCDHQPRTISLSSRSVWTSSASPTRWPRSERVERRARGDVIARVDAVRALRTERSLRRHL
jgi:hypothetical protein